MPYAGTPRPATRWTHAATDLDAFAIVSYRVDADRLADLLPPGCEPERCTFDDGTTGALVSAVPFIDRDFHFVALPMFPVRCGQVNYRAYVRFRGARGVWFFGTSLDSPLVALPRLAWQMPWHRDRITVTFATDGPDHATRLAYRVDGAWGDADCELDVTARPLGRLDGFPDDDTTLEVLTHPMVGWYRRRDGGIGRYSVWHPVLEAHICRVRHARFGVFERLGLVAPGQEPHSALAQRRIRFDVHTPPARVG